MDDLLQEFVAETRETLEALSGEIVAWESDPTDRARLDAIFRFVHTVKGSCGFLDLPRLSRLSHAAEDVLAQVRSGERAPDTALVDAVLAIVDRIGEIVEAIDAGAALDDSGEDLLIAALEEGADTVVHKAAATIQRAPTRSVRLSVDLLDRMMSGMSDMVLARNELARRLRDDALDPAAEAALERLTSTVGEMRDTVTRTRMQKIDALFSALPRMVRDTAAAVGKSVTLVIEGGDVELDRELVEMIRDPLVHVIRNAIDHGIEGPGERKTLGKRENGRLSVSARQSGNQVIIEVADDGRGIDTARLAERAIASGHSEARVRAMSEAEQLDLIFEPGFTSKDEVTAISGRGVGMDVVRANIGQIGGHIELANAPGRGLAVIVRVPLTLSILSTIVVGVANHRFAVPRQAIEEIVGLGGESARIDVIGTARVATLRGEKLPVCSLARALGLGEKPGGDAMMVVLEVPGGRFGLLVDAVFDAEELVVKPVAPVVMAAGIYAGQTLPDNGEPMLLLDSVGLATQAGFAFGNQAASREAPHDQPENEQLPGLLFEGLDGVRRLMPLGVIERIETAPLSSVRKSAGRLRLASTDGLVPIAGVEEAPIDREIEILRLSDGAHALAYAMREAIDIVAMPDNLSPAAEPGEIAGVVLLDGEPVEVIDVPRLFERCHSISAGQSAERPLVLVTGAKAAWLKGFLAPMLQGAGYRVTGTLRRGERADLTLALDDAAAESREDGQVLRLRRGDNADADTVPLHDRDAIIAALAGRRW